jgi:hypothetical protein
MRAGCKRIPKITTIDVGSGSNGHTSLLPRPKPLMTGPESLIGKGATGPESGPATGSRGPSGRIVRQ